MTYTKPVIIESAIASTTIMGIKGAGLTDAVFDQMNRPSTGNAYRIDE